MLDDRRLTLGCYTVEDTEYNGSMLQDYKLWPIYDSSKRELPRINRLKEGGQDQGFRVLVLAFVRGLALLGG